MRRLPIALAAPVLAAVFALTTGCSGSTDDSKSASTRSENGLRPEKGFRKKPNVPATPEQEAVFTFLDEDKQRFEAAVSPLPPEAKPSAVTAALSGYLDQITKADTTALPGAVRSALDSYRSAGRNLVKVLDRLPDNSAEGTAFYTALGSLFRNEFEKGKSLGGDVVNAVKAFNTAHAAVYATAGQFGLDVDR